MARKTEFYFLSDDTKIPIIIDFEIDYDGIGHYESWGAVYFDAGNAYISSFNTRFDKSGLTPEQIDDINLYIDENVNTWEETILEEYKNRMEGNY